MFTVPAAAGAIPAVAGFLAGSGAGPAVSGPAISGFGGGVAVAAAAPPPPEFWALAAAAPAQSLDYSATPGTIPAPAWGAPAPVQLTPSAPITAGLLPAGGGLPLPLLLVGGGLLLLLFARRR